MKLIIEISDDLLIQAENTARQRGIPLSALIEEGLATVTGACSESPNTFRLQKRSARGEGLNPDMGARGWDEVRALSYGLGNDND